jgi:hypothetical protein
MKAIITFFLLVLVPFATITAQDSKDLPAANGPEIAFIKTVHDYGEIFVGSDGNSTFVFTNTGNEPLILSRPRSSCGCTVPSWPRQPILPGESDSITVTYNTANPGRINRNVTIVSNARNSNSVVLRITGNVTQKPQAVLLEKNEGLVSSPGGR